MRVLVCFLLLLSFFETKGQLASSDTGMFENFSFFPDVMMLARRSYFTKSIGSINPNNQILKYNYHNAEIYLRPDIKYQQGNFSISVKPRLFHLIKNGNKPETTYYFQEAKLKLQFGQQVYFSGGRYVKSIGTSFFINPSNPYFISSGRLNPKIEIRPIDFAELNIVTQNDWDISLIANVYGGELSIFKENFFKFSRNYGIHIEKYNASSMFGGVFSISEDERYHFGYYAQKTVNEGLVVWLDGAVNYNPNRFYPVKGHRMKLLNYEMVNADLNKKIFITTLLGGSYTFKFGPTLYFEYMFNQKGYDEQTFDLYNNLISDASNYTQPIQRQLAGLNLGRALNTGMSYLRRNTVFSQIGENDLFGKLNYSIRYFYALDDNSSQLSSLVEFNMSDNLEAFALFFSNFGSKTSSFNQLFDYQIMFGFTFKI